MGCPKCDPGELLGPANSGYWGRSTHRPSSVLHTSSPGLCCGAPHHCGKESGMLKWAWWIHEFAKDFHLPSPYRLPAPSNQCQYNCYPLPANSGAWATSKASLLCTDQNVTHVAKSNYEASCRSPHTWIRPFGAFN